MKTKDIPSWVTGMTMKRPEVAQLVHSMLVYALQHGCVTAEDVHYIPVTHPNSRGVAAKYLRRCGLIPDRILTGRTRKSHGHFLYRWIVEDYEKLNGILSVLSSDLCKLVTDPVGQLSFL